MEKACMLTTIDNPYNPFTQFSQWFLYDELHGYHTCGYIGRIAHPSDKMTDQETAEEIERAIDEIVELDFMNIYVKVCA